MKKILSILCALSFILCANATRQSRINPNDKAGNRQFEQHLKKASTDKDRLKLIYDYKTYQKSQISHDKANKPAIHKVKRAKKEVSNLTIDRYTTFYSADNNTVFYGLHEEEGRSFFFEFPIDADKHDIKFGVQYNLTDMNAEMSEWDEEIDEETIMHHYTEATFLKNRGEGFDIHIVATLTDEDGNQFALSYDEQPVQPTGNTVDVNIARPLNTCEYISSDRSWLLRANDNTFYVTLRFYSTNSESPEGSFAIDDIDLSSTYLDIVSGELDEYDEPIQQTVYAKDATIKVTVSDNGNRIDVSASILGEDGNKYDITLFFAYPEAKSEENFAANNLSVDDWALEMWGEVQLFADNDQNSISLDLFPEDAENGILGTYAIAPGSSNNGSITAQGEQFDIYTGTINIAKTDDKYVVTGTVLAWNNVSYTLNLTTPDPTVTELDFTGDNLVIDIYSADAFFEVAGFDNDKEKYLLLTINSPSVAGQYTQTDLDSEYTYVEINGSNYSVASTELTVNYTDGNATLTGTMLVINNEDQYDHVQLTLNLKAGPYVPSERNLTIQDFAFGYTADHSVGYILGTNDYNAVFSFNILDKKWAADIELGKTYTLDNMLQNGTYGENYEEREYVFYQTVSFTKTKTDEGVELTVDILDSRGNNWHLSYKGEDKEYEPIYVELGQANNLTWDVDNIEYEMIDKDNSFACYLIFSVAEGVEDIELDSLYTGADGGIELENSYLSIQKEEHQIVEASFEKSQDGDVVLINATVVDDRGFTYKLSYYDDGFKLTGETIQVVIESLVEATYWEDYYEWTLHAENDTISVQFSINSTDGDKPLSEYEIDEINTYASHIDFLLDAEEQNWWQIGVHSIETFSISGNQTDGYSLSATIIGEDGNVYEIAIAPENIAEGLDELQTIDKKAVKRLVNGIVVIEKDGVLYNMQGATIQNK